MLRLRDSIQTERTRRALLLLILLGGAILRLSAGGVGNHSLTFQVDEHRNILLPLSLSWTDLKPRAAGYGVSYDYPAFLWYMLFGFDWLVFQIGRLYRTTAKDWGAWRVLFNHNPLPFFLLGRTLSAVLGTATVGVVYLLGRRLFSPAHGLLAAGFLAYAFLHVRDSALATTDAPATFFIVLSLLGAAAVFQEGRVRDYMLAAGAAGLATATKYDAFLVLISLGVAHGLRAQSGQPPRRIVGAPRLLGALLFAGVVFLAVNPYLLLDWPKAVEDLAWQMNRVKEGQFLDIGPGWWYHFSVSLRYGMGVGLLGLAMAGVARTLWRRERGGLVLLSFVVGFYLVVGSAKLIFVRYMTPLLPTLCLFAAMALLSLTQLLKWPRARPWVAAGLGLLAIVEPLYASAAYGRMVHHVDTRVRTDEFIRTSLPPGTVVATYGSDMTWRSTIPRFEPAMFSKDPDKSWAEIFVKLKARGIHYFLTHHSGLEVFSPTIPELELALLQSGTLIQEFSPYAPGTDPHPVYDRVDPHYFPIGGFRGVRRPGPLVRLYRLR